MTLSPSVAVVSYTSSAKARESTIRCLDVLCTQPVIQYFCWSVRSKLYDASAWFVHTNSTVCYYEFTAVTDTNRIGVLQYFIIIT